MVKIKLTRLGVTKKPFYRIVAIEEGKKLSGKPAEVIGYWNPSKKDFKLDKEKYNLWLKKGAQLSVGVKKLVNTK